jgi:hypothetical protein
VPGRPVMEAARHVLHFSFLPRVVGFAVIASGLLNWLVSLNDELLEGNLTWVNPSCAAPN